MKSLLLSFQVEDTAQDRGGEAASLVSGAAVSNLGFTQMQGVWYAYIHSGFSSGVS